MKILVVGSINIDQVIELKRFPNVGETYTGKSLNYYSGGKGANQAVALSKLGCDVSMMGKVGDDPHGKQGIKTLGKYHVKTEKVLCDPTANTGLASIYVTDKGNNEIVLVPGANYKLSIKDIDDNIEFIKQFDIVVAQFEIPIEVVKHLFEVTKKNNIMSVLNPAPAQYMEDDFLKLVDFIIPNETELKILTKSQFSYNETDIKKSMDFLLEKGVKNVIVTCGDKGVYFADRNTFKHIDAQKITPVDTTAAGDSFIAGFISQLVNTQSFINCIEYGVKVASITITRKGAQESIPTFDEIKE